MIPAGCCGIKREEEKKIISCKLFLFIFYIHNMAELEKSTEFTDYSNNGRNSSGKKMAEKKNHCLTNKY